MERNSRRVSANARKPLPLVNGQTLTSLTTPHLNDPGTLFFIGSFANNGHGLFTPTQNGSVSSKGDVPITAALTNGGAIIAARRRGSKHERRGSDAAT